MIRIRVILFALSMILSAQGDEAPPKLPDHVLPVLRNWLHGNSEVVEVCIFREEWKEPTQEFWKGTLLRYATITRVHKGNVKVGEQVVLTDYYEYSPSTWKGEARRRPSRTSLVDGELMLVMFNREDVRKKDKYLDVGDDVDRFSFDDDFYRAFQFELKRDPALVGVAN